MPHGTTEKHVGNHLSSNALGAPTLRHNHVFRLCPRLLKSLIAAKGVSQVATLNLSKEAFAKIANSAGKVKVTYEPYQPWQLHCLCL